MIVSHKDFRLFEQKFLEIFLGLFDNISLEKYKSVNFHSNQCGNRHSN